MKKNISMHVTHKFELKTTYTYDKSTHQQYYVKFI